MVSIIILQYNNHIFTKEVVASIKRSCAMPYEIIVVDNASTNAESKNITAKIDGIRFLQNSINSGFGGGNNFAAQEAKGDILLFLNNDIIISTDIVGPILRYFSEHTNVGIVGPKLLNQDGTYQLSCGNLPSFFQEIKDKFFYRYFNKSSNFRKKIETINEYSVNQEWVTGAALYIRRDLFFLLNGFDEKFFMYFEDKDLCVRAAQAGFEIHYFSKVFVTHLLGGSVTGDNKSFLSSVYRKSQWYYYQKHRTWIEQLFINFYIKIRALR